MPVPTWVDRSTWPWTPVELSLPEGKQHAIIEGAGPTVVLVHGTPTWSYEWRHVVPALASTHRVVAVDHLGFGLSARPANADYSPEAHARRFRDVMRNVAPDVPVSLVVHDFGGPIALDWALDNVSRLAHLVIVNSFAWSPASDPAMWKLARLIGGSLGRLAYRHLNLSQRTLMPAGYAQRSRLTPAIHAQYLHCFPDADSRELVLFALARSLVRSADFFAGLETRLRERAEVLASVPVTLLWGLGDKAFGKAALTRWRGLLPHAQVGSFEDAGHWPHEEYPEAFNRALQEALQR